MIGAGNRGGVGKKSTRSKNAFSQSQLGYSNLSKQRLFIRKLQQISLKY